MTISVSWGSKIISVAKADMTMISAVLYELNVNTFRLALKSLEDDAEGMPFLDTHRHNTEVTLGGVTLARTVEIINGYTVTFEAGSYAVSLVGANNNIADVMNLNAVSLRSANSAGLIVGAGAAPQDVVDELMAEAIESGMDFKAALRLIAAALAGKISGADTPTVAIRNAVADTKTRIIAEVGPPGRYSITYDLTD